jgi:hypothetical protein
MRFIGNPLRFAKIANQWRAEKTMAAAAPQRGIDRRPNFARLRFGSAGRRYASSPQSAAERRFFRRPRLSGDTILLARSRASRCPLQRKRFRVVTTADRYGQETYRWLMKRLASHLGALCAVALLAGCATDQGAGVQAGTAVTRFHLGQPIARGQIAVEPSDPADRGSLEFAQQAAAVEAELTRLGWTVAQGNARSEQVALVHVSQVARDARRARSGVSIGVGAGTGGYRGGGVGVGVGGTIPVGGGANQIVTTQLSVRIQRRSDATVAWEGRAETEARAGAPLASPGAAVSRLAEALFRDFPGESGRTIRLR